MSEEVSTPQPTTESQSEAQSNDVAIDQENAPVEQPDDGSGIRKFKVKVNGQEVEVDENELIQGYQTRKASDEKFREAAMSRKQAEEFINLLRTDPVKVLSNPKLGIDFRNLAEEYLANQLEEEMLDPQEKELREYKRKLKEYEDQKKEQEKAQEQAQAEELRKHYTEQYTKDFTDALESSGLPRTNHTLKRMAYYMHQGAKRGMNIKPAQVTELVKQDYINEQKELFGSLDSEMLVQLLGDDVANKIRKHDIAKLKNPKPGISGSRETPSNPSKPKKTKKLTKEEWYARNEKRAME